MRTEIIMRQGYAASTFYRSTDVDSGEVAASLMLDRDTWEAMGKPETITVTVDPSDTLNTEGA